MIYNCNCFQLVHGYTLKLCPGKDDLLLKEFMCLKCNWSRGQVCVKFLLHNLAELTNRIHCNSQREALMNRFPVMIMPIGQRELTQEPELTKTTTNCIIKCYLIKIFVLLCLQVNNIIDLLS